MIITRRLRASFADPGTTIDFYAASVLIVFGLYFLQPTWLHLRYPRMAREMAVLAPIWVWGACVAALGALTAIAAVWRSERILAACYILSFGFWLMIGWIFCVTAFVPPVEGLVAPLSGWLSVIRASQLPTPTERTCAH